MGPVIECTDCGARNARTATFCVRCGDELVQIETESAPGEDTDRLDPMTDEATHLDPANATPHAEDPTGDEAEEHLPVEAVVAEDADQASDDPETEIAGFEDDEDDAEIVDDEIAALLNEAADLLAEDKADAAAARCRDVISRAPDLVAAYSLLGMAEEARGNTIAAAGAYRRVLQLDPDRQVEREKLELLHVHGGPGGDPDDQETLSPFVRYAPWVASVGAALFILMLLTGIGWRSHLQRQAQRTFQANLAIGAQALDSGDYQGAMEAFDEALALRPDDDDARQGLRDARRMLMTASDARSDRGVTHPVPHTATLVPSRGPNPFQPVPIGPTRDQDEAEGLDPEAQQHAQQPQTSAPRPPVVSPDRVTGEDRRTREQEQPSPEAVPFGPLEVENRPDVSAQPGDPEPETAETAEPRDDDTDEPEQPKRRGEISIWVSETPAQRPSDPEREESPPPRNTEYADRARDLRSQADRARQQGDCSRAVELYNQAIESYRRDSQANPSNRASNQAAIAACERARALCGTEGQ